MCKNFTHLFAVLLLSKSIERFNCVFVSANNTMVSLVPLNPVTRIYSSCSHQTNGYNIYTGVSIYGKPFPLKTNGFIIPFILKMIHITWR